MSFTQEVDKVESVVRLPLVLRILGIIVLAVTVWKGVHHFWPTFGLVIGAIVLVAAAFLTGRLQKKSGDGVDKAIRENLSFLPTLMNLAGGFILAITVWKGVHGFVPSLGVIVGGVMLLVGGMFNKIYK